jgi:hypothetical protein
MLLCSDQGRFSGAAGWVPSLWRDQKYPALKKCNYTDNELFKSVIGAMICVNASNGNFFWGAVQPVVSCNCPMFADGRLFMGATDAKVEKSYCDMMGIPYEPAPPGSAMAGWMWAFDAYTGKELWKFSEEAVGLPPATPSPCLVYMNDKIYFGSYADSVFCLDPASGEVIWWRDGMGAMGGQVAGPVGADGVLYCGGAPWRVYGVPATTYALDAETGATIWSYNTAAPMKHMGAVADGILYWPTGDGWLYAFGDGPTKTTLDLSTKQLKAGDTVLISGQVLDQSPASPNAPVANAPVTLMYTPLGSVNIATIATVTTSYSGDYYYEWTVPNDLIGMNSIVVSFAGIPGYKASSTTTNFRSGSAGLTQTEINQIVAAVPQPAAPTDYTPMFYAVIAVAAIAVVIGVVNTLLVKKLKK